MCTNARMREHFVWMLRNFIDHHGLETYVPLFLYSLSPMSIEGTLLIELHQLNIFD